MKMTTSKIDANLPLTAVHRSLYVSSVAAAIAAGALVLLGGKQCHAQTEAPYKITVNSISVTFAPAYFWGETDLVEYNYTTTWNPDLNATQDNTTWWEARYTTPWGSNIYESHIANTWNSSSSGTNQFYAFRYAGQDKLRKSKPQ